MMKHRMFRWLLIGLTTVASVLIVALLLLPWYIRPILEQALSRSLQQPVEIAHIQWDLPSGLLQVSGLNIAHQKMSWQDMQLLIDWTALRHHRVEIARLHLESPRLTLIQDADGIRLAGLPPIAPTPAPAVTSGDESLPWQVILHEFDLQFADVQWRKAEARASAYVYWLHGRLLREGRYAVQGRVATNASMPDQDLPQAAVQVKLNGTLDLNNKAAIPDFAGSIVLREGLVETSSVRVALRQWSWDGYTSATAQAVTVHGGWQLHGLDAATAAQGLSLQELNWQGTASWPLDAYGEAQLDGQWHAASLHLAADAYTSLDLANSDWQGTASWPLDAYGEAKLDGQWHAASLHLAADAYTSLDLATSDWQGSVSLDKGVSRLHVKSQLSLDALHLARQHAMDINLKTLRWRGDVRHQNEDTQLEGLWQMDALNSRIADQRWLLQNWRWQGTLRAHQGDASTQLDVQQQLQLQHLENTGLLSLNTMDSKGAWALQLGSAGDVTLTSKQHRITLNGISLTPSADQTTTLRQALWQGDVSVHGCAKGETSACRNRMSSQGEIQGRALHMMLPQQRVVQLAALNWQGMVEASAGGEQDYQGQTKSRLQLQTLEVQDADNHLQLSELAWQGGLSGSAATDRQQGEWQGDVQARDFALAHGNERVQWAQLDLHHATAQLDHTEEDQAVTATWDDLRLNSLLWPSAAWGRDGLAKLALLEGQGFHFTMRREAASSQERVNLDALHLAGVEAGWRRVPSSPAGQAVSSAPSSTPASADAADTPGTWHWRVASILLDGENHLDLHDTVVAPAWRSALTDVYASIGLIDSDHADRATPFKLAAKLAPAGQLHSEGEFFLRDAVHQQPGLRSKLELTGLDAAPFSGYVESVSGYALQRGTFHAAMNASMQGTTIDSMLKLQLDHLQIVPKQANIMDTMQGLIGLSPEAALDTLRDSNDSIKLDIPIVGNAASPDFKIGQVVQKALGGSLQKGALMYLKYAFQPYGAMLGAAMWVGEQMHAVRLPSIPFAVGEQESAPAPRDEILRKVAGVLQQTPTAALAVCGTAVAADRYAQPQTSGKEQPRSEDEQKSALLQLARQRGESIIGRLQNEWHVKPSQLQRCRPEVVDEASPEVRLLL